MIDGVRFAFLFEWKTYAGFGIAADTDEGKSGHEDGAHPAGNHDAGGRAEFEAFVEVDGPGDGVPSFCGYYSQGVDRENVSEDGEEARYAATDTCSMKIVCFNRITILKDDSDIKIIFTAIKI